MITEHGDENRQDGPIKNGDVERVTSALVLRCARVDFTVLCDESFFCTEDDISTGF